MAPLLNVKVMLILTLIFPNYHITEIIPFDNYAACHIAELQQQNPDYGPFRFQIVVGTNNGDTKADSEIPKPDVQIHCETYNLGNTKR